VAWCDREQSKIRMPEPGAKISGSKISNRGNGNRNREADQRRKKAGKL
jgi:hypothetical protein